MFSIFHTSRTRSVPITAYRFEYGLGMSSKLLLTDAEAPVTLNGEVYQPVAIQHGNITASGTLDKASIEIRTPRDNPLVELFRAYPPDGVVNVRIFQGERDDPNGEFHAIWGGRVLNFALEGSEAKFTCDPVATSVRRPGLRRTYNYGCPHVLYGPQCRANKAAASITSGVEAVSGSSIVLPPGWNGPRAPNAFLKGMAEWTLPGGRVVTRTILQVNGNELVLNGPATSVGPGMTVTLAMGCAHTTDDCASKFNNILNYGGQPWISKKNPMAQYNFFY